MGLGRGFGGVKFFFTGGREGRLVVANKVCREDYTIECQLTGNEGGGGHITVRISLFVPLPPSFRYRSLILKNRTFQHFFFQGCTQFILEVLIILRQKKGGKQVTNHWQTLRLAWR